MSFQVEQVEQTRQQGTDVIQKIASFQMPTQEEYVSWLQTMHLGMAMVLFICGLVYLLQGWKIFKMLVIVNAAVLGAFVGSQLDRLLEGENIALFGTVAGGLLFGVLSWPLMKFAVSIMGGLAGSFLGYGAWQYIATAANRPQMSEHAWAGALIGLITLGLLAVVIFRTVVMIFTSIQGSLMTVSGIVALVIRLEMMRTRLLPSLRSNIHLLVLLVGVPAVIGFAFQYAAISKVLKKKKPAGE